MKDISTLTPIKKYVLHCSIYDSALVRIDKVLVSLIPQLPFDLTRSQLEHIVSCILVNGKEVKKSFKVKQKDELYIEFTVSDMKKAIINTLQSKKKGAIILNDTLGSNVTTDYILDVLYEDELMLIVNKPRGMVVHPGEGHYEGTLSQYVFSRLVNFREEDLFNNRAGIVHRLDKDTSGVIVIAKTARMHEKLSNLFAQRAVIKRYLAVVKGIPRNRIDTLETYIGRHHTARKKFIVVSNERYGKFASTSYRVIFTNNEYSIVLCQPHTGRTHQIRVHMQHIGSPIVGDVLYARSNTRYRQFKSKQNSETLDIDDQICPLMLHAYKLSFSCNIKEEKKEYQFVAPIPQEIEYACKCLGAIKSLEKFL